MKMYKKPSVVKKAIFVTILLMLSPIIIPMLMLLLVWQLSYHLPIMFKMRAQPLYWLTWHEVKRMTGRSTAEVIDCLQSGTQAKFFECRYRDRETVEKLRRRMAKSQVPPATGPVLSHDAIFFEFRIKDRSGRRTPRFFNPLASFIPSRQAGLQPAYAR